MGWDEDYAVDSWHGPALWVDYEEPPPPDARPSPLTIYWVVFGYLAAGGVLAWIGEALHGDLPTLCALWLIMGAWLWVLAALRDARG